MLVELSVRDLGVIAELQLVLGAGMTAVTGETGAGKTLVVEAIELLVGGRADPVLVRPGADEAVVEGRFADGDDEVVVRRVVPAEGRSRAYVDGRMAPASALADLGRKLVDLHGQHAHQSLLGGATQRRALDAFGGVDLAPLEELRKRARELEAALASLGGDGRSRAREIDLLRYQLEEIEAAGLRDPDEEAALEIEEDRLAGATAAREAARAASAALAGDGGALDSIGAAVAAAAAHPALAERERRLRGLAAEVADAAEELRHDGEVLEDDPERLEAVRARRAVLRELRRKYGDTLAEVIEQAAAIRSRLDDLTSWDARAAALDEERAVLERERLAAAAAVQRARREAAPRLASAIEVHLRTLALPRARFEIAVGDEPPGDDVTFLFGANAGEPALPLTKVASGGELARAMLAARLVVSEAPPTLVFDEVDAGIGGEAGAAVGRALARLAEERQVLVVTHLPQVAAFADHHVAVTKHERSGRTIAGARRLDEEERVVELSRMLSGQPESDLARGHAAELLATAASERGR